MAPGEDAAATFDPLCPRLARIAYRMLGSVADAEDVVQEAFLRWLDADRMTVREPEAFLRRVVTRLCLDHLKSARHRSETCVGSWLPEPVVEAVEEIEDVTLPLMLALERLSPLERAAFRLHDVFGLDFDEVALTIGRERPPTAREPRAEPCARRAPALSGAKERGLEIAAAFFTASRGGDMAKLRSLLANDVSLHADGGGKVRAVLRPLAGIDEVLRLHASLARIFRREDVADRAIRHRQRRAGLRHGRAGFQPAGDGDADRGWPHRRDLRHAQPGQAAPPRRPYRAVTVL